MNMNDNSTSLAMPIVEIYTDGGCEPNPGPGGYGVVLLHPRKRAEASGGFRLTTNNRMEIFAAIAGLEMLKQPCQVTLYSDSQYLVKATAITITSTTFFVPTARPLTTLKKPNVSLSSRRRCFDSDSYHGRLQLPLAICTQLVLTNLMPAHL